MRVTRESDSDDIARELELLHALRPLVRSPTPYRLLREAVLGDGLSAPRLAELRRTHHNAQRILDLLGREKFVETAGDGVSATRRGRQLVANVRRAVDAEAAGELVGRRLVLVEEAPDVDMRVVERTLGQRARVVRSEGSFERIAILRDDYRLATDLLAKVRRLGARARMARVVEAAKPTTVRR